MEQQDKWGQVHFLHESRDKWGQINGFVFISTRGRCLAQKVSARDRGTCGQVSRNEIIYALNQTDKFLLAIVIVDGENHDGPHYIRNPFNSEPDFGVVSINYSLEELLSRAVPPDATLL